MKLHIVENYEEASQLASQIMLDVIKNKPNAVLGLATGSTPIRLYELLVKDHQENKTSYKDVQTYNLDEYFGLDITHPQSYYHFMYEHLFQYLDIQKDNIHVPKGTGDIEENCKEYNEMLKRNPVDIQLLGIGSNGHIGFNEPGTSFDSMTHYIKLKESTRLDNARLFFDNNLDLVPTHSITMGIKNIMDAKTALLIACGENKAPAIKEIVEGRISTDCPATALLNHPDFILIIDKAAAKLI